MRQEPDWYEYLKLPADAPAGQIEAAVERLSRQAAALAATAPERSQQLRERVRAIKRDLLLSPESRARYDASRAAAVTPQAAQPAAARPAADAAEASARASAAFSPPPPPPPPAPPAPPSGGMPPSAAGGGPATGEGIGSRIARFLRTGWTCSSCGKEALPSDKFCTRCGTPITPTRRDAVHRDDHVSCAGCGAALGVNDAFCARCGTAVRK